MAKKTDIIRVDQSFADALRKQSEDTGQSIIEITAKLKPRKKTTDPFALHDGGI